MKIWFTWPHSKVAPYSVEADMVYGTTVSYVENGFRCTHSGVVEGRDWHTNIEAAANKQREYYTAQMEQAKRDLADLEARLVA